MQNNLQLKTLIRAEESNTKYQAIIAANKENGREERHGLPKSNDESSYISEYLKSFPTLLESIRSGDVLGLNDDVVLESLSGELKRTKNRIVSVTFGGDLNGDRNI